MSILEDLQKFALSEFNGTKSQLDPIDLEPGDALVALNCRFSPGKVRTREGFAEYAITTIGFPNYISTPYYFSQAVAGAASIEYLSYVNFNPTTGAVAVVVKNLSTGTETSILSLAGSATDKVAYAVFASNGARLYAVICQFSSAYTPTRAAYVWDGNTSNQMIACFQRPMKTTEVTEALTQPGAGVITAGTHYVGVIFQTKPGYWTKPGPADATTLALVPQSIVSTGTNNIRVTLTPATTWPTWIQAVQVIMTTAQNSFDYYLVPGTITAVTGGSATVYTIDLNISDLQLTSIGSQGAGTLATDYFSLLSMNASNVAPFSPKGVANWGQRVVWFGTYDSQDAIFPSEQLNPEWITADQHLQRLPGGKPIGAPFVMRGVLYAISAAGGIYSWVDNGGRPVSFSPPTTIDEHVTVNGFYSVTVAASGGYALIATLTGLYAFSGGAFPTIPLSYNQTPTYDTIVRVTTGLYDEVQVIDHTGINCIILYNCTNGLVFVWDYNRGMTPEKVNFSNWTSQYFEVLTAPAMTIARLNGVQQLVIAGVGPRLLRLRSIEAGDGGSSLYADLIVNGINWQYQTAPLPPDADQPMLQHLAIRVRAKSLLNVTFNMYLSGKSLDDARTITIPRSPIAINQSPGTVYEALYDAQEERLSYLFTNNTAVGVGISIARLTHFYDFMSEQR